MLIFFMFAHLFVPLQAMQKVLFLHGFFASGQCVPANALRDALDGKAEVLSPDLPLHPKEALAMIKKLIADEKPDILVGNRRLSSRTLAAISTE